MTDRRDPRQPTRRRLLSRSGGRRVEDGPEDIDALLAEAEASIDAAQRLVDAATVARKLRVTPHTVRNWCIAGKVDHVLTVTGRYRVPVAEVARLSKIIGRYGNPENTP